jgi:hypothetical protein
MKSDSSILTVQEYPNIDRALATAEDEETDEIFTAEFRPDISTVMTELFDMKVEE